MEIKYLFAIDIGIILAIAFAVVFAMKKSKPKIGAIGHRYGNLSVMYDNPIYKKKVRSYRFLMGMACAGMVGSIISASVLASRLHKTEMVNEEQYCRDIIICLDASTSVDEVNVKLINELKDTVSDLRGERMGILIFNTSPIMVAPLTDDYEFILEQLDTIQKALEERIRYDKTGIYLSGKYYLYEYIQGGTLIGNEERGSSLIGDGLASCVSNFTNDGTDRAKVVILATDNEPYGDGYFELQDAARLCKDHGITVFGVGTGEMTQANILDMKTSVESTGGQFYQEGESGTFENIVGEIEKLSSGLVAGKSYVKQMDQPKVPFVLLILSLLLCFIPLRILRK